MSGVSCRGAPVGWLLWHRQMIKFANYASGQFRDAILKKKEFCERNKFINPRGSAGSHKFPLNIHICMYS